MLERVDTAFLSPFPGGSPDLIRRRVRAMLKELSYAGVEVEVDGVKENTKKWLEAGKHELVIAHLAPLAPKSAGGLNDLGCAMAWAWTWDRAEALLGKSKSAGGVAPAEAARAESNLAIVIKAKETAQAGVIL